MKLKDLFTKRYMGLRIGSLLIAGTAAVLVARAGKLEWQHPRVAGKPAPELVDGEWINSKPLKIAGRRGKVTVVEFWTYG